MEGRGGKRGERGVRGSGGGKADVEEEWFGDADEGGDVVGWGVMRLFGGVAMLAGVLTSW